MYPDKVENMLKSLVREVSDLRKLMELSCDSPLKSKDYLTVSEAAKYIGKHPDTVRRWLRDGSIKGKKLKGGKKQDRYVLLRTDVDEFLAKQRVDIPVFKL